MSGWVKLQREVRFHLEDGARPVGSGNSFAGNPSGHRLNPLVTLKVEVGGSVDTTTGMLINIRKIDEVVWREVLADFANAADVTAPLLLQGVWPKIKKQLAPLKLLALEVASNPWLRFCMKDGALHMIELTERFEFSAAHRLHTDALTEAANVATFGKCNNPNGHGHNYELEVTLSGPINPQGELISLQRVHDIVNRCVIDRMDHKHLNIELAEFGKLNPTVENIAAVIFDALKEEFPPPVRLGRIRLWETPKTSCTVDASPLTGKEQER